MVYAVKKDIGGTETGGKMIKMPGYAAKLDRFSISVARYVEICMSDVKTSLISLRKVFEVEQEELIFLHGFYGACTTILLLLALHHTTMIDQQQAFESEIRLNACDCR